MALKTSQVENLTLILNNIADLAGSQGLVEIEKLAETGLAILGLAQLSPDQEDPPTHKQEE